MKKILLSLMMALFVVTPVMADTPTIDDIKPGDAIPADDVQATTCDDKVFFGMRPWYYGLAKNSDCSIKEGNFKGEEAMQQTILIIILNVVHDVMLLAGVVAFGFLLFGAYRYIRAGGDAGMVAKGKRTITTAIIGLVIVLLAEIIVNTIGVAMIGSETMNPWGFYENLQPDKVLKNVVSFVLTLLGTIAVGFIIASGIQMATAAGDPGKLQRAKSGLITAVVGVAVAALGSTIINFLIENMATATVGNEDNLWKTVSNVFNVVAAVAGFVAICGIVYGGVMYMSSAGDASKVTKGKNAVIWSSVGLIIVVLATMIINFVLGAVNAEPQAQTPDPDPSIVILDEE